MLIELFLTHLEEAVAGNVQQVEEELYQIQEVEHNLLEEVEHNLLEEVKHNLLEEVEHCDQGDLLD